MTGVTIDFFDIAVGLAREEAAPVIARAAQKAIALNSIKTSKNVCCCSAYSFKHRPGGGECPAPEEDNIGQGADSLSVWAAEELAAFDRAEARAINSGAW